MKYYVIAGSVFEFDRFTKKKSAEMWNEGNTSVSLSDFLYVSSVNTLRGLSEIQGFYVGTWKNRSDISEIQSQIHIIKEKMKHDDMIKKITESLATISPLESVEIKAEVGPGEMIIPDNSYSVAPWSLSSTPLTIGSLDDPYITESRVREIIQEELSKLQTQP